MSNQNLLKTKKSCVSFLEGNFQAGTYYMNRCSEEIELQGGKLRGMIKDYVSEEYPITATDVINEILKFESLKWERRTNKEKASHAAQLLKKFRVDE